MSLQHARKHMAKLRGQLGRKGWSYCTFPGSYLPLDKNHPSYNPRLSYRDNIIINMPSMKIRKPNCEAMLAIEISMADEWVCCFKISPCQEDWTASNAHFEHSAEDAANYIRDYFANY